jgi:hypothetical protein
MIRYYHSCGESDRFVVIYDVVVVVVAATSSSRRKQESSLASSYGVMVSSESNRSRAFVPSSDSRRFAGHLRGLPRFIYIISHKGINP